MPAPVQRVIDHDSISRVRAHVREAAQTSGRTASDVAVLAAVKYVDAATCRALVDAGITELAENRRAALEEKRAAAPAATWHFIGRLQSREAADIAAHTQMIHSLCSASAAARLHRAEATTPLLVQVNIDGDATKDGIAASDVAQFLDDLPDGLTVHGFMTMPAWAATAEESRGAFAALRDLRDALAPTFAGRHPLAHLSMGTTQDYRVAIEEGATHVRLGRILFADAE